MRFPENFEAEFAVQKIAAALRERGATLACAESCTGGLLAGALTEPAGASAFFRGGAVTYATDTKTRVLGVPAEIVARHGVVSAECAEAMARGAAETFGADFALSTTGVAGPSGGSAETPVGTVFLGLRTPRGVSSRRFFADFAGTPENGAETDFAGTARAAIRRAAVRVALAFLAEAL